MSADCYYPTTSGTAAYQVFGGLHQAGGVHGTSHSKNIVPDTWTRLSFTIDISEEGEYYLRLQPNGNAGAFYPIDVKFKNIQLEQSSAATSYSPYIADFSSVTLKKYGKNLLPYPYYDTTKTVNGITFTDNGDGSVTISGTANDNAYFYLQRNADYGTKQIDAIKKNSANNGVYTASSRIYYNAVNKTVTINILSGTTLDETVYPQVELGVKATDYEAYVSPTEYTPSSDGTVTVASLGSEDITLISDTDGVIIEAKYNRDINKAFSELYALVNG